MVRFAVACLGAMNGNNISAKAATNKIDLVRILISPGREFIPRRALYVKTKSRSAMAPALCLLRMNDRINLCCFLLQLSSRQLSAFVALRQQVRPNQCQAKPSSLVQEQVYSQHRKKISQD